MYLWEFSYTSRDVAETFQEKRAAGACELLQWWKLDAYVDHRITDQSQNQLRPYRG